MDCNPPGEDGLIFLFINMYKHYICICIYVPSPMLVSRGCHQEVRDMPSLSGLGIWLCHRICCCTIGSVLQRDGSAGKVSSLAPRRPLQALPCLQADGVCAQRGLQQPSVRARLSLSCQSILISHQRPIPQHAFS